MYATSSFAPPGLTPAIWARTHGLRRGLHSSAAPRLPDQFDFLEERHRKAVTDITIAKRVVSKWDPQNASSDRGPKCRVNRAIAPKEQKNAAHAVRRG
jgi:hypothetical protein